MRQAFHQRQASLKGPQTSKKSQKTSQLNSSSKSRPQSKQLNSRVRQTNSRVHNRRTGSDHPLEPYNLISQPVKNLNTFLRSSIGPVSERRTEDKITSSPLYKRLMSELQKMKKSYTLQITSLHDEIKELDQHIQTEKQNLLALIRKRDKMENDVHKYNDELIQLQQKNYQMYWDVAAQINQEEGLESYEELLQLEEQIGHVSKGLKQQQIDTLFVKWIKQEQKMNKKQNRQNPEDCESCCICCHNLAKNQSIMLPCKHTYHSSCIKEWLTVNRVCPLCRKDVKV